MVDAYRSRRGLAYPQVGGWTKALYADERRAAADGSGDSSSNVRSRRLRRVG